ncbi:MAG TPA: rhamnogalacturonan acetylesterase [Polyangia bacterium]|jgi:lysophospholipase L1-like esterase
MGIGFRLRALAIAAASGLILGGCGSGGGDSTGQGGGGGGPAGTGGATGGAGGAGGAGVAGSGGAGGTVGPGGAAGTTGAGGSAAGASGGASAGTGGGAGAGAGGSAGSSGAGGASGGARGGSGGGGGATAGASGAAGSAGRGGAGGAAGRGGSGGGRGGAGGSAAGGAAGNAGSAGQGGTGGQAVGPNPDPATRAMCTGTDPIACHFGGQPGNYDVTVVLGGAAAGNTIVQAETLRAMLGATITAAGATQRLSFTVNVRQPEGQPIQDVDPGTPGLDVYFLGNAGAPPQLQGIGYAAAASPFVIYIAGDSTVCDQTDPEYGGWGQQLPPYFNYPVSIANYADSGESSASFLNSGSLFGAINSRLKANDWVLVQFGHNDKDTTATAFHDNMTAYVTRVKAKNALPVLITPVARATFSGNTVTAQHINNTGADLPAIVRQVGMEQNVPVLDMTARTVQWLTQLGPKGWQQYHALGTDATHTNPAGAAVEAGFVIDLIKQANLTALVTRMR